MSTTTTEPRTLTPPVFADYDTWTAFAALAPWSSKPGNRVCVGTDGTTWLQTPAGDVSFPLTSDECVQLAQFLCEQFDLRVLNEPSAWGNEPQACECEHVPNRVACVKCGGEIHTCSASGKDAAWEANDDAMTTRSGA